MKVYFLIWIFILQHTYSHACPFASLLDPILNPVKPKINEIFDILNSAPQCMTVLELYVATKILCKQEINNTTLWASIIQCHRPIDDDFLRKSGEAQCPIPRQVQDATDTQYPMEDVFFNICGLVRGNLVQLLVAGDCIVRGDSVRNVPSHGKEVSDVRNKWGKNKPCEIGTCVKALGFL